LASPEQPVQVLHSLVAGDRARGRAGWWFLAAAIWLGLLLNLRYPAKVTAGWSLLPAFDLVVLFGLYAVLGARGRRLPAAWHGALVGLVLIVRFVRFADGLKLRYFHREFTGYIDLPLLPELGRLLGDTLSLTQLLLVVLGVPVLVLLLTLSISCALRSIESALQVAELRRRTGLALVALLLLSPCVPDYGTLHSGAFAPSLGPRLAREISFWFQVGEHRERQLGRIAEAHARLPAGKPLLDRLDRQNVLLFLIESYGETLLERSEFAGPTARLYAELETGFTRAGFHSASAILDSPTYGGGSWLAHATLASGVRVDNQLEHELMSSVHPPTLPMSFRAAGYRTVAVLPGNTRPLLHREFLGFEHSYYAWMFGYRGPRFGWATMPDQYVLDFARRKELESAREPLFMAFALISSHAPWSVLPPTVDDWSKLGDGSLFHQLEPVRTKGSWSDLAGSSEAYFDSIRYDLELLTRFLIDFIGDDSLVIWAGDHQPAPDVTAQSPKHGVPVHVISRRAAFLEPFLARGYERGLRPAPDGTRLPMETLLLHLLQDFSAG
jgi:hypothetical protein